MVAGVGQRMRPRSQVLVLQIGNDRRFSGGPHVFETGAVGEAWLMGAVPALGLNSEPIPLRWPHEFPQSGPLDSRIVLASEFARLDDQRVAAEQNHVGASFVEEVFGLPLGRL